MFLREAVDGQEIECADLALRPLVGQHDLKGNGRDEADLYAEQVTLLTEDIQRIKTIEL